MRRLCFWILSVAAAATLALGLYHLESWSIAALGYLLPALSAYGGMLALCLRSSKRRSEGFVAGAVAGLSILGLWMLWSSYGTSRPDAQSGLFFLVAPLDQWGGLLLAWPVSWLLDRRSGEEST